MLYGFFLVNRASYRLNEYFEGGVFDRDDASGLGVDLQYVGGDPAKSGPNHLALCGSELLAYLQRQALWYQREVRERGKEQFFRLQQMEELRRLLNLSREDFPGIAFLGANDPRVVGILRIRSSWYASETALNAFDSVLRNWLASGALQRLAAKGLDGKNLASRLKPLLVALTADVEAAIGNRKTRPLRFDDVVDPSAAMLVIDRQSQRCFYRGEEFRLTLTPFRLLTRLAESPGAHIAVDDLATAILGDGEDSILSTPRWIRDHKFEIMKSLRELIGRSGIAGVDVDRLIERRSHHIVLNLGTDDVLVI